MSCPVVDIIELTGFNPAQSGRILHPIYTQISAELGSPLPGYSFIQRAFIQNTILKERLSSICFRP
jgi:hypothetical protein